MGTPLSTSLDGVILSTHPDREEKKRHRWLQKDVQEGIHDQQPFYFRSADPFHFLPSEERERWGIRSRFFFLLCSETNPSLVARRVKGGKEDRMMLPPSAAVTFLPFFSMRDSLVLRLALPLLPEKERRKARRPPP